MSVSQTLEGTSRTQGELLSLLDDVIRGRDVVEDELASLPLSVLVWGPGEGYESLWEKRAQIAEELTTAGFDASTSEALMAAAPSTANPIDQERVHWQAADLVYVLDFSPGPGMELATFCSDPSFVKKTCVFFNAAWHTADPQTYGASVIANFPNRVPFTETELVACSVVGECLSRAKAERRAVWLDRLA